MSQISIEQHWIESERGQLFAQSYWPLSPSGAPIVLWHDSLGCVELWRDFPERLAQVTGRRVIAYDRLGFGRSAASDLQLPASFIEDEVRQGFTALYQQLGLEDFIALGHSVGGAMAVTCAAAYGSVCRAVIAESAQALVDSRILAGIRLAEEQFAQPGQLARLQRYHAEKAQWVLRAWVDTWQSADFRQWQLDGALARLRCPLLVLHGERDEYGSREHPERMCALAAGPSECVIVKDCGHVPHRERPEVVLAAVTRFLPQIHA